jgi:hypothetical protein
MFVRLLQTTPDQEEESMAEAYTLKHLDDLEEMEGSGGATWHLARKTLGAESFGFNVVDIDGQGTIVAGDEEHEAPAGTFCRFAPEVHRTIRNKSGAPVRALLIGVPVNSGYTPMSWG